MQRHASSVPVSAKRSMPKKKKAKEIGLKLNVCDACFSTGWLHKFKMPNGISSQVIRLSTDVPAEKVDEWLKNLPHIIDEYKQKDIYNVDESGYFIISCMQELSILKVTTAMMETNQKILSRFHSAQPPMVMIRELL